tara:strand:- start:7171 stop:7536 length:366 start_codon:yes stop_codon:yes gene_type:complete
MQLHAERDAILTTLATEEATRQRLYNEMEALLVYDEERQRRVLPMTPEGKAWLEELRLQNLKMHTAQENKIWNSLQLDKNLEDRGALRILMASERQQLQQRPQSPHAAAAPHAPPLHRLPR